MLLCNRKGFRGYIGARLTMGRSTPQHIQQLVMREYCKQRNMSYLLAAVEYRMPGCTMILDAAIKELDHLEGIVMYSIYLFPQSRAKRMDMYRHLIEKGATLHTAVEGHVIKSWDDAMYIEDCLQVNEAINAQKQQDFDFLEKWELDNATH